MEKLSPELCRKLVEYMPRRLEVVYKNKSYHTKQNSRQINVYVITRQKQKTFVRNQF